MVQSNRPARNDFNCHMRLIYNLLWLSKAYNFILWFFFSGALFGFLLARAPFLNFSGIFCGEAFAEDGNLHAGPGQCWNYSIKKGYEIGVRLHLAGIIPGGLLALLQFIPAIRHKVILFHRING